MTNPTTADIEQMVRIRARQDRGLDDWHRFEAYELFKEWLRQFPDIGSRDYEAICEAYTKAAKL